MNSTPRRDAPVPRDRALARLLVRVSRRRAQARAAERAAGIVSLESMRRDR